jgi:ATP:ADP antiporter, AAA family
MGCYPMRNNDSIRLKRIVTLYLMGFMLIFGYAFARPCIDSIFLDYYSNDDLPVAGLTTSLVSFVVIAFYNRFNQRYAILSLFAGTTLICTAILGILLFAYFIGFIPAIFILYVWKEIYMVVLMETYWSFADIVFSINTARYAYGMALAVSSLGGILGNLLVGPVAKIIGTRLALCLVLAFLLICYLIAFLGRKIGDEKPNNHKKKTNVGMGIKTLLTSKYLVPLAILVCTVQVVTGLIDYQFTGMLQENFINTEMRTEMLGQIHAAVNIIGISIQLLMGPILRIFGIGNTFKSIPFLLSTTMIIFILFPHFALMIAVKISNKALDYSLFRGVKEILYIPLTREEKTQGKGIVDIFMYRLARGLSSLLLLVMITLGITSYVMQLSLVLAFLWLVLAAIIAKRYQNLTTQQVE